MMPARLSWLDHRGSLPVGKGGSAGGAVARPARERADASESLSPSGERDSARGSLAQGSRTEQVDAARAAGGIIILTSHYMESTGRSSDFKFFCGITV